MFVSQCNAVTGLRSRLALVDKRGCVVDSDLMENIVYSTDGRTAYAFSLSFRFHDDVPFYFSCHIRLTKVDLLNERPPSQPSTYSSHCSVRKRRSKMKEKPQEQEGAAESLEFDVYTAVIDLLPRADISLPTLIKSYVNESDRFISSQKATRNRLFSNETMQMLMKSNSRSRINLSQQTKRNDIDINETTKSSSDQQSQPVATERSSHFEEENKVTTYVSETLTTHSLKLQTTHSERTKTYQTGEIKSPGGHRKIYQQAERRINRPTISDNEKIIIMENIESDGTTVSRDENFAITTNDSKNAANAAHFERCGVYFSFGINNSFNLFNPYSSY
ncbi:hypothetical protein AB6A40_003900 [Gnathostoma spinigerum]|uniref:ZP domain-containing protein n=1 Tax=Gnathostoma spinigerum TaxID=75299 RepID=A0ABD6EDB6_9BILA